MNARHASAAVALWMVWKCEPSAAQKPGTAPQTPDGLRSPEWVERSRSFYSLKGRPGFFASSGATGALVQLLETENGVLLATLRASGGRRGVSTKYGEGYSEYYKELIETCDKYCDKERPGTVEALARGAYGLTSPLALLLAKNYGARVVPVMRERLRSELPRYRYGAVVMLNTVATTGTHTLANDRSLIHDAIVGATRDSATLVREVAAKALGDIGTKADSQLLKRLAADDPSPGVRRAASASLARMPRQ